MNGPSLGGLANQRDPWEHDEATLETRRRARIAKAEAFVSCPAHAQRLLDMNGQLQRSEWDMDAMRQRIAQIGNALSDG